MNHTEPKPGRWILGVAWTASVVVATIAFADFMGWILDTPLLVSYAATSIPLQFNTAVCLLLCAFALMALLTERRTLAVGLAATEMVIAAMCAVEIFLAPNSGIMRMFFDGFGRRLQQSPLAPNSAIPLLLAGAGAVLLGGGRARRACSAMAAVLAAGIAAFGVMSLAGYAIQFSSAYRWGKMTPMSLPAAAGVLACGLAIVAIAWASDSAEHAPLPSWSPFAVLSALATVTVLLFKSLQVNASLTQSWTVSEKYSLYINTIVTLVIGFGISIALAVALAMARKAYVRSRQLEKVNAALDQEIGRGQLANQALQAERQRLHDVFDMLPAYVVLLTHDYHVPFANHFFEERFGRSEGRRCYEYLFQRNTPCENCETFKVLESGGPHDWEWTGPDQRNYEIHDFPFTDSDGSPLILEMGIDVTARKAAEAKLDQANRALRLVCACDQALAHAEDETALLQNVCDLAVRLGGYRMAWIGYAQNDPPKSVRPVAKAGAGTEYVTESFVTWSKDPRGCGPTGRAIRSALPAVCNDSLAEEQFLPWRERAVQFGFRSSIVVPLLRHGRAFGAISIYSGAVSEFSADEVALFAQLASDLAFGIDALRARAERRHAEHRLRQQAALLDLAPAGIVVRDLDSRVVFWSHGAEQLYGWTAEEAAGRITHELLRTEFPSPVQELTEQVLRTGRWEGELVHKCREGRRITVASRWAVQHNDDGAAAGFLEVNVDITERKREQEELARYTEELKRSNTELQEFAFVASHDLQEPLRKITAFSERLRDRCEGQLDAVSVDFLHRMHNAAARMASLIDSLLEYSRLNTRALPFESVDLATTFAGVLADLEQRIRDTGARITVRPLPRLDGDPVQLRQLLQNLLANALKFHAPGARPQILVDSVQRDGTWEISIVDNGIGFDPSYTDRIFRPFQRLHGRNEYEGSGMGLAICRKIAQRHSGEIEAHSELGKGSTFRVRLPVRTAFRAPIAGRPEPPTRELALSSQH